MLSALTPVERGYSAPPFRMTDTPEAPVRGSFRTVRTFLSDHKKHFQQIATDLAHADLNPAHDPF